MYSTHTVFLQVHFRERMSIHTSSVKAAARILEAPTLSRQTRYFFDTMLFRLCKLIFFTLFSMYLSFLKQLCQRRITVISFDQCTDEPESKHERGQKHWVEFMSNITMTSPPSHNIVHQDKMITIWGGGGGESAQTCSHIQFFWTRSILIQKAFLHS